VMRGQRLAASVPLRQLPVISPLGVAAAVAACAVCWGSPYANSEFASHLLVHFRFLGLVSLFFCLGAFCFDVPRVVGRRAVFSACFLLHGRRSASE
jgi:hypothetical protein